ncbi:patatin-like phospholipase family protein [Rhodoferax ferrireducens]|uniref:patatin-like phospholipase family protein n=1 Tax=Rhodoferax ferrireducens TaxID=192843 RepID=UPI00298D9B47|nr:patatin-like phospholipase family protein [Rhodoferax ferrireducens]WPC66061.1 patatin-like phospholipase family protein [Rhodoferax ferrireducens]
MPNLPPPPATTGLVLSGGGARAAYQVGVLEAIADIRKAAGVTGRTNPFPIITGTSAGAVNAAALACGADDFDTTVRLIAEVWRNIHAEQIYRSDSFSMLRSIASLRGLLALGWAVARWRHKKPRSLLDNSPLVDFLDQLVPLERLPALIRIGHLQALAVTASSYSSGEHITFFQGDAQLMPWERSQRRAVRDRITHAHLLASSAIPFVFPATPLQIDGLTQYFGDGSMRQSAPVAAAIHLGASRILVIGAGRMHEPRNEACLQTSSSYPSLAQIAGHTLSNIFLDALAVDVERMRRINQTLSLVPPEARCGSALRPVELLMIAPSQRFDTIASRHIAELPPAVRTMLGGVGVSSSPQDIKGGTLASYLLFEGGYTRELMALGHADAMRQRVEVCTFFGWIDPATADQPGELPDKPVVERRLDPLRLR